MEEAAAPAAAPVKVSFGLKAKAKARPLVVPALAACVDDDDEDEQPAAKRARPADSAPAPPAPAEADVALAAERLAEFVAKNGPAFEEMTRERNPGETPFKFLYDTSSAGYLYYQHRLAQCKAAAQREAGAAASPGAVPPAAVPPVAAVPRHQPPPQAPRQRPAAPDAPPPSAASAPPGGVNSLALMELYMRRAAEADRSRAPTFAAADAVEVSEPAADDHRVRGDGERAHHLADYIPPEQLVAMSGGGADAAAAAARAAAAAISARERLGADNRGHQLLSRMGWTEGAGLGAGGAGHVEPVAAQSNGGPHSTLGVGAGGSAGDEADIFEAYQKRMALGYKYRPNPLNNPRKQY